MATEDFFLNTFPVDKKTRRSLCQEEECDQIDFERIPKHIAIIMDGNRRWAIKKNQPVELGHWRGAEALDEVVRAAAQIGIKALTVYAFSTENWKRSQNEIKVLMQVLESYLINRREIMIKEGVSLHAIGDLSKIPKKAVKTLKDTIAATSHGNKIDLILALNYGGRDDIRRAFLHLFDTIKKGNLCREEITEELISSYLDTAKWGDPDILIRTSGECRISNFLIWQISYSEIYYTEVLWPDFSKRDLFNAVVEFQKRQRRFGL